MTDLFPWPYGRARSPLPPPAPPSTFLQRLIGDKDINFTDRFYLPHKTANGERETPSSRLREPRAIETLGAAAAAQKKKKKMYERQDKIESR